MVICHGLRKVLCALTIPTATLLLAEAVEEGPVIYMIGDSTMADKPDPDYPERGWGQLFRERVKGPARLENHAMNGRSTRSFIDEGRWQVVRDLLKAGDWVIIQFGHNDEKVYSPRRYADPYGAYRENLKCFVEEARSSGAHPVLVTPVARRSWNENGELVPSHADYPTVVRNLAESENVPLLEMERRTADLEYAYGVEGSKALHLWFKPGELTKKPDGLADNTHYSEMGARLVADIAVREIIRNKLQLAEWLSAAEVQRPAGKGFSPDAVVAADGSGDFASIEAAIYAAPAPAPGRARWVILVKPGVYRERVYVQRERGNIALIGEDPASTVLVNGTHASMTDPLGGRLGTFRTPTLQIDGDGFMVENLTIANDAGPVGQALALRVDGDRVVFRGCRFKGWQDTLLVNRGRHFFENCYIEGGVDFIFGGASAFFENCQIHCLAEGYISAPSTPADQKYGLIFSDCRISGEPGVRTYLGRPWRAFGMTAFLNTEMSDCVRPAGWNNWGKSESTIRFSEFGSVGPGAGRESRVAWAHPITAVEAHRMIPAIVFPDWYVPLPIAAQAVR